MKTDLAEQERVRELVAHRNKYHHPLPSVISHVVRTRRKHDDLHVMQVDKQVRDADGRMSTPYKVMDTLDVMHSRGTINADQLAAGRRFQKDFAFAHLDALKPQSFMRITGGYQDHALPSGVEAARRRVREALVLLGGDATRAGSLAWNVIGMGVTISEWTRTGNDGHDVNARMRATGALKVVLDILHSHYSGDRWR